MLQKPSVSGYFVERYTITPSLHHSSALFGDSLLSVLPEILSASFTDLYYVCALPMPVGTTFIFLYNGARYPRPYKQTANIVKKGLPPPPI